MQVGLFFGSFNPIHIGHLIIANHFIEFSELEQVWFVISPQNPFKKTGELLDARERVNLVELAIADDTCLKVCTAELKLPKPSYTVKTLTHLKETYPDLSFRVIMGSDNLKNLHKWKDYQKILEYGLFVFKRREFPDLSYQNNPHVKIFDFPFLDISATYIRSCLKQGKSVKYLLPPSIWPVIKEKEFYK